MSRNQEMVLKFGSIISLIGMIGLAITAHFHGQEKSRTYTDVMIVKVFKDSKEYTDNEVSHVKEDVMDLKKKMERLQSHRN